MTAPQETGGSWPVADWFGTRDAYTVTGADDELDAWLDPKGWNVDAGEASAVRLVHTGTTVEPVYLAVRLGERLLWDGWHLIVEDPARPNQTRKA